MDIVSIILSAVIFYVFVPGVLVTLPSKSAGKATILITHALLFTAVISVVMRYYWRNIKGYMENFGNYGNTCPAGYAPGVSPTGVPDCVPVGGHR